MSNKVDLILNLISRGRFKESLKAAEALHTRRTRLPLGRALMAMSLSYLRRVDAAVEICAEIEKNEALEAETLDAIELVYKHNAHYASAAALYEKLWIAAMNVTKTGEKAALYLLLNLNFEEQKKLLLRLYNRFKNDSYIRWIAVSMILSHHLSSSTSFTLLESIVKKMTLPNEEELRSIQMTSPNEYAVHSKLSSDVMIHLSALRLSKRFDEAIEFIEKYQNVFRYPKEKNNLLIQLYVDVKAYDIAADICASLLSSKDCWEYCLALMEIQFTYKKKFELTELQQLFESNDTKLNALAILELYRQSAIHSYEMEGCTAHPDVWRFQKEISQLFIAAIIRFVNEFGDTPDCFHDIRLYVSCLDEEQNEAVGKHLSEQLLAVHSSVMSTTDQSLWWKHVMQYITIEQCILSLRMYYKQDTSCRRAAINRAFDVLEMAFSHEGSENKRSHPSFFVLETLLLFVCDLLLYEDRNLISSLAKERPPTASDSSYLLIALSLIEWGVERIPNAFQLQCLNASLCSRMGLIKLAISQYEFLQCKSIQNEALAYIILPSLTSYGAGNGANNLCDGIKLSHNLYKEQVIESIGAAFEQSGFSVLPNLLMSLQSLDRSLFYFYANYQLTVHDGRTCNTKKELLQWISNISNSCMLRRIPKDSCTIVGGYTNPPSVWQINQCVDTDPTVCCVTPCEESKTFGIPKAFKTHQLEDTVNDKSNGSYDTLFMRASNDETSVKTALVDPLECASLTQTKSHPTINPPLLLSPIRYIMHNCLDTLQYQLEISESFLWLLNRFFHGDASSMHSTLTYLRSRIDTTIEGMEPFYTVGIPWSDEWLLNWKQWLCVVQIHCFEIGVLLLDNGAVDEAMNNALQSKFVAINQEIEATFRWLLGSFGYMESTHDSLHRLGSQMQCISHLCDGPLIVFISSLLLISQRKLSATVEGIQPCKPSQEASKLSRFILKSIKSLITRLQTESGTIGGTAVSHDVEDTIADDNFTEFPKLYTILEKSRNPVSTKTKEIKGSQKTIVQQLLSSLKTASHLLTE